MNVKYQNIINNDLILPLRCLITDDINEIADYPHVHDEIEILYVLSGRVKANLNEKIYTVKKDGLIILNRLCPHYFINDKPFRVLVLQFKPSKLYDTKLINIKYLKPFFYTHEFRYFVGSCETPSLSKFPENLLEIERNIHIHNFAYDLSLQICLMKLLYLMHSANVFDIEVPNSNKKEHDIQQLSYLLKYLDSHFSEDITLQQACDIVKLDYHYFSRIFKEQTGKSFVDYLRFLRILNSQRLLIETNHPISFVAESVGFPNVNYFNRVFKFQNNMTPSEYRNNNRI